MEELKGIKGRSAIVSALMLAGLMAVFSRLVGLVVEGGRLESIYRRRARRVELLPMPRGAILDRGGRRLAVDVPSFSVYADPSQIEDPRRVARALAPILGVPPERLLGLLSRPRRSAVVACGVDEKTAEGVRGLGLPFVRLVERKIPAAYDVYVRPDGMNLGVGLKLAFLWGASGGGPSPSRPGQVLVARSVPSGVAEGLRDMRGVRLVPSRWERRVDVVVEVDDPRAVEGAIPALSRVLGISPKALRRKLSRRPMFCWLKRDVSEKVASEVAALAGGEGGLKGVGVKGERKRIYPNGAAAGQVIGFVNIDEVGLEGLERFYDAALRPGEGKWETLTDGRGRPIPGAKRLLSPPIPGFNVVLSLDIGLQLEVEEELDRACRALRPRWGAALVLDPWTGEVLALANWPPFDPNRPADFEPFERRNHAVVDTFEPGSTFKVAVAAAALEEGVAGPGSRFWCGGKWEEPTFGGRPVTCWIYRVAHRGHGWLSFTEAIVQSCNIALAKMALALGAGRLREWVERLGFLSRTEVDFPGEPRGAVEGRWGRRKVASLGYGQGIRTTLLSMARFYCAVANGGYLVRPHLVREIRTADGRPVWRATVERRKVLSGRTCKVLRRALLLAVERGTGRKAKIEGYTVAGKTGTADQVNPRTGRYDSNLAVASFIGFAPAWEPRVVVAVAVAAPKGPKWGGEVAAPLFARVTRRVLLRLGVPPSNGALALGPTVRI